MWKEPQMAEKSSGTKPNDRVVITFYIPKKLGFLKQWIERDAKRDKLSISGYLTRTIICTYVGSGRHFPEQSITERFSVDSGNSWA